MAESPSYRPRGADEVLATLSNGLQVKQRIHFMRACTQKDAKGKICRGHIKRWFQPTDEVKALYGAKTEFYECERCHTVYLPNPEERPRTRTLAW